jgi:hypothetical protein
VKDLAKKKDKISDEELEHPKWLGDEPLPEVKTERRATGSQAEGKQKFPNAKPGVVKKQDQLVSHKTDQSDVSSQKSKSLKSPTSKRSTGYRFSREIDGKSKAIKTFRLHPKEDKDGALQRLRGLGYTFDESKGVHLAANKKNLHVGNIDKCPRCVASALKSGGPSADIPEKSTFPLNSVEDVKKAWTTIPANTIPYFELICENEGVILPLISKPYSINRAVGMFEKARWFQSKKPEVKATILGKAESHECPGAVSVRVSLAGDMSKFLKRISGLVAWAPALVGDTEKLDKRTISLTTKIQCGYTPQKYNPKVVEFLKDSLGTLKKDAFKPEEDKTNGRHDEKGNETTEKSD